MKSGRSLANMCQRPAAMGGALAITSALNQGATVVFSINV